MDYYNKYIEYKYKYLCLKGGALSQFHLIVDNIDKMQFLFNYFVNADIYQIDMKQQKIAKTLFEDDVESCDKELQLPPIKKNKDEDKKEKYSEEVTQWPSRDRGEVTMKTPESIKENPNTRTAINFYEARSFATKKAQPQSASEPRLPVLKQMVIDSERENDQSKISDSVEKEDKKLQLNEELKEEYDEEYIYNERILHGKIIECWIADNFSCPSCRICSLRRYVSPSMPAIDLICTNFDHNPTQVRFFQVKATIFGTEFRGNRYFDIRNQQIHVGSKKFGEVIHDITCDANIEEKKLLMGYICVSVRQIEESAVNLYIIPNVSFIVLPKLMISNLECNPDNPNNKIYYKYININRIQYSTVLNTVITFNNLDPIIFKQTPVDISYDKITPYSIYINPCSYLETSGPK